MGYKLIKRTGVLKRIKELSYRGSAKFLEKLEYTISEMIEKACQRALESRRRTLLAQDV